MDGICTWRSLARFHVGGIADMCVFGGDVHLSFAKYDKYPFFDPPCCLWGARGAGPMAISLWHFLNVIIKAGEDVHMLAPGCVATICNDTHGYVLFTK